MTHTTAPGQQVIPQPTQNGPQAPSDTLIGYSPVYAPQQPSPVTTGTSQPVPTNYQPLIAIVIAATLGALATGIVMDSMLGGAQLRAIQAQNRQLQETLATQQQAIEEIQRLFCPAP